ncbi:inner membrane protein [Roseateles sp. YR242]|uniref:YgjV family protein n=1 Tax=Roseateles sp. YR242 TaxID=1855305 RepID=UPI0008D596F2|nr:YgjV family protein [Roseateles sp. YR242]SEK22771.1 inner membrane protein [Roseateles sp. YR242]
MGSLLVDLVSFQVRGRERVLVLLSLSTGLLAVQFGLLDAWTSAALMLLASARFLVSRRGSSPHWEAVFLSLATVIFLILPFSMAGVLAWLGNCAQTHAAFLQDDRRMRVQLMVGTLLWIAHNLLLNAWVSVLAESAFLLSNGVGLLRFHILPGLRKVRPIP